MLARPQTFLLDENLPRKILTHLRREGFHATRVYDAGLRSQPDTAIFIVLRSFPRSASVNELADAVLKAAVQLALVDISNRVYRLDPSGLEEEP